MKERKKKEWKPLAGMEGEEIHKTEQGRVGTQFKPDKEVTNQT